MHKTFNKIFKYHHFLGWLLFVLTLSLFLLCSPFNRDHTNNKWMPLERIQDGDRALCGGLFAPRSFLIILCRGSQDWAAICLVLAISAAVTIKTIATSTSKVTTCVVDAGDGKVWHWGWFCGDTMAAGHGFGSWWMKMRPFSLHTHKIGASLCWPHPRPF